MAPEQLAQWIAEKGLSQAEFARRLSRASRKIHVDQTEVSRWLRKKRFPNADEMAAIEKVTGVLRSAWPQPTERPSWSE